MKRLLAIIALLSSAALPQGHRHDPHALSAANIGKPGGVCAIDGTQYSTIRSAIADTNCNVINAQGYTAAETWSTNVLGVSRPLRLIIDPAMSEIDLTSTQTISVNNISIEYAVNPYNNSVVQAPGIRFKATGTLDGPMIQVNGPVSGFNLNNIHLDCNGNATWAIIVDRLQNSSWRGQISSANCTAGGFRFQTNGTLPDQNTMFNSIDTLWVWGSPACVEFDKNAANNEDFSINVIQSINCNVTGSSGATDAVFFQGADGNYIGNIWCVVTGGNGTARSCVHLGGAFVYENVIGLVDSGVANPAVINDAGNSYPNLVEHVHLGNFLSVGRGTQGNEVTQNGPIIWSGLGLNTPYATFNGLDTITATPREGALSSAGWKFCVFGKSTCTGIAASTLVQQMVHGTWFSVVSDATGPANNATVTTPDSAAAFSVNSANGLYALKEVAAPATPGARFDACYADSTAHAIKCSYNNGPFLTMSQVIVASFTTTAAGSDNVTIRGMTASGHCYLEPTNSGAAGGIASVFVSAKNSNQITVTHAATSGWTFDVICTPN